jgi:23S rRNA (guanosine2251-2'-O)-methyltransferase
MKQNNASIKQKNYTNNDVIIYGNHSFYSALKNIKRNIKQIYLEKQHIADVQKFLKEHKPNLLPLIKGVSKETLSAMLPKDSVHQGHLLICSPLKRLLIDDFLQNISNTESIKIAILDEVQDSRNIGAIIRSCVAFNIDALLLTKNCPKENSFMVKSSVGAIEYLPIIEVANLQNALEKLKKEGFWSIGLSAKAKDELHKIPKFNKTALIFGSEDSGMRDLTEKNCDYLAKININSKQIDSLNISNAAAIGFYEISK